MLELLRTYQLDLMLILSGACATVAFFVAMTKSIRWPRRKALLGMEIGSAVLLLSDRVAYLYRGDPSATGFWAVRISNFLVYLLTLVVIYAFSQYVADVCCHEGGYDAPPSRLRRNRILLLVGMGLVVVSQFTGLYYTFDASNTYQRAPGFVICYAIPLLALLLDLSVVWENCRRMSRMVLDPLLTFSLGPLLASLVQVFAYGLSLTNMTMVFLGICLYVFALVDLNEQAQRAHRQQVEFLKAEEREAKIMFEQTAQALASAIDAKDAYTHGHSSRVARYARMIAERAGKREEFCERVYYAGLLHDVGKIGIPDAIINKEGRLTDEEFAVIKTHPVLGDHILESIEQSPYLQIGARWHHERYDGRGYPDGLAGTRIPDMARVIAVADAYDAMTSKRSYRATMPQEAVREQIEQGLGSQFDPTYGQIMLDLIDEDTDYRMREGGEEEAPGGGDGAAR